MRVMTLRIKTALLEKNIKQRDIADQLGISRAAVAQYIAGKQKSRRFEEWVKTHLLLDMAELRELECSEVECSNASDRITPLQSLERGVESSLERL